MTETFRLAGHMYPCFRSMQLDVSRGVQPDCICGAGYNEARYAEASADELVDFIRRIVPAGGEHNSWVGDWRIDRAAQLARRAARAAFIVLGR